MNDLKSIVAMLAFMLLALICHFVVDKQRLYAPQLRADIAALQKRIKVLEKEVEKAKWDALWAQNLLVVNMHSVADEIRRINKKVGMSLWGWSPRE